MSESSPPWLKVARFQKCVCVCGWGGGGGGGAKRLGRSGTFMAQWFRRWTLESATPVRSPHGPLPTPSPNTHTHTSHTQYPVTQNYPRTTPLTLHYLPRLCNYANIWTLYLLVVLCKSISLQINVFILQTPALNIYSDTSNLFTIDFVHCDSDYYTIVSFLIAVLHSLVCCTIPLHKVIILLYVLFPRL